jgi:hypothetical protein
MVVDLGDDFLWVLAGEEEVEEFPRVMLVKGLSAHLY